MPPAMIAANPLAREAILICAIPTAVFPSLLAPRYDVYVSECASTLIFTTLAMIVTLSLGDHADWRMNGALMRPRPLQLSGNLTVTVVPAPTWLAMSSLPPCNSTSEREIASPRPEPPLLLVNWFSTCSNGRPSLSISLAGMPMPVSRDHDLCKSGLGFRRDRHLAAFRRELDGIGEKIDEHLLEGALVGWHRDIAQSSGARSRRRLPRPAAE